MPRLTEDFIKNLSTDSRTFIADSEVKGFALRSDPNGKHKYVYRYRFNGRQCVYTIGSTTGFTAAQARKEAKKIAGEVERGINPNVRKKAARAMPIFREYATQYIESTNKRSIADDKSKLDRILVPKWGSRPLDQITNSDVRKLLLALEKEGKSPATVNRYRSLISALFNRAVSDGIEIKNPVDGIKPLHESNERTRWLNGDELERFLEALALEPENARNCILMMLLTGIRRGDVMKMRWDHIEAAPENHAVWSIPRTKSGKKQIVHLSGDAVAVLEKQRQRREAGNPFVFPGRDKDTSLRTVQQTWTRAIKRAGLKDIRLHDLRHTFASHAVSNGVPLFVVSKLLGHSSVHMSQRYSHLADDTIRGAASTATDSILKGRK